jgi:hypothetical protein
MPRQRIKARTSPVAFVSRLLLIIFALALLWYGLMVVLLFAGVPAGTVDLISGYRTSYDFLSGLTPGSLDNTVILILAASGFAALLIFGFLAYKEVPRPYATRHRLDLVNDERGDVEVAPRAIERVAETAAFQNPAVSAAAGRYGESDLTVDVHVSRPRDVLETLRDVQQKVAEALGAHELPPVPVGVTLTGFDQPQQQREIS